MSQSPKQHSTSKLFYRKYLYKIELCNNLNNIFRSENQKNKNLDYARDRLDEFASNYRNGEPLIQNFFRTSREVPMEHYLDAKNLYLILKNEKDFTIRVENGSNLSIYTNDKYLLDKVVDKMQIPVVGYWKPARGTREIILKQDTVLVDKQPEFPLKIYFSNEYIPTDFSNWLRANRDKSRIGDKALWCIDRHDRMNGFYFYVRDDKVLSIVSMLVGHAIRRVEKLVYVSNVDK